MLLAGRRTFAWEGKIMLPNKILVPKGSIDVQDDVLPVTYSFAHDVLLGHASEFHRDDETGALSMLFELENKDIIAIANHEGANFWNAFSSCMYLNNVSKIKEDGKERLISARLRAISIVPTEHAGTWGDA